MIVDFRSALAGTLRTREAGRSVIKGLKLFVPPRSSDVVCSRLSQLNPQIAEFHLFELDERDEIGQARDLQDRGNIATRLVRRPDEKSARSRFAAAISRIASLCPECQVVVLSSSEVGFRLHGLEFARVRIALDKSSFRSNEEIVFRTGSYERALDGDSEGFFDELVRRLRAARRPDGDSRDPLWRMYPERWLESLVCEQVTRLDSRLDPNHVYVQVPAFTASDRAMIDVLTLTCSGRLAVIELKADEDIHLPLQGLDYWGRVKWHEERGEFQQFGYFLDHESKSLPISSTAPLLLLVSPAFHVHPAVDTVLRYFPQTIDWELIGLDEHWREGLHVVFRKRNAMTVHA